MGNIHSTYSFKELAALYRCSTDTFAVLIEKIRPQLIKLSPKSKKRLRTFYPSMVERVFKELGNPLK